MVTANAEITDALAALSSAWLPAILDESSAVIYIKDRASRHLLVNRRFEEVFGVSRRDVLGKTNRELFPQVAATLTAHDTQVIEQGGCEEYEEVVVSGAETYVFLSRKFALRDARGNVVGVCGISTDVRDRRIAEARLHQEQELTQRLVNSSADGILAFDTECRYTVWNPRMERISGLPAASVLGRPAFDLFPFLVETGEDHYFYEALAGRTAVSTNRRFVIPESGREGFFEGHYSPLHDAVGRVIGGLGVIRDVTERRHAEEERVHVARVDAARAEAEAAAARFSFLAEAGETLASSLDYEQTLREVARLALPALGDACIVDVLEDGELRRVATAHVIPAKAALLERLRREYPPDADSPQPSARALRSGRPELLPEITPDLLVDYTRDAEHARLIRAIGMRSHVAVPLVARGNTVGVIGIGITESDRRYDEQDVALALDLARRAALAVDNARLYRAAQSELAERRRVEDALRLSEERFRAMFEQSPLSTQLFSPDGLTQRVNAAWEQLWGVPRDRITDYNVRQDPQLTARGIAGHIERAFAGYPVEIPAIRYDPQETIPDRSAHHDPVRWVRAFAYPVKDPDGSVREVVLVHEDVTARVHAQEQLRASEEATRLLADVAEILGASLNPEVTLRNFAQIIVPRLADFCAVDLMGTNHTLERVSAFHTDPAKAALGMELFQKFPPQPGDRASAWSVVQTGEPQWAEHVTDALLEEMAQGPEHLRLLRAFGVRSYIRLPLVARGTAVGVLTLVYAESQRRYRERDLALARDVARRAAAAVDNAQLYQRLREEDRRKDEFLATLAHELRNPLAPLRSGLDALRMSPSPAQADRTRQIMERQLSHMVRLVDDLLDVSRVTRAQIELRHELLDLPSVVGMALEVSGPAIEAARLELTVRLPDTPIALHGDRTRLAQVLSNLLNNAAKYTPAGGRIDVEAARDGAEVVIQVRDSGVGIPREMLAAIFEMFTQVGPSHAHRQGGLGIGLTLVKRLVELHGGRVWAESEGPGQGSTFVVRLPASPEAGQSTRPSEPALRRTTPVRRVLVVDDNVDAAEMLSMLLELDGHEVRSAANALSALELVHDFTPDVAFLDIGLPDMSGLELARSLRARSELAGTLLVAVTGWGQEEDRRQSREAGFDHHLTKPVDVREVRALIQTHGEGLSS